MYQTQKKQKGKVRSLFFFGGHEMEKDDEERKHSHHSQGKGLIFRLSQRSEDLIYHFMHEHSPYREALHQSSKELFVYKSLESIMRPKGRKADALRSPPFREPLKVWLMDDSCFDVAQKFRCHGMDPLVQVPTFKEHFENRSFQNEMNMETELVIRTTAIYPLRGNKCNTMSKKFRDSSVRHCMSLFIPKVYIHSENHEHLYEHKPVEKWQMYSLCLNSGIDTMKKGISSEDFYRILRGKLNCPFDVAMDQRCRQTRPWSLDTLILSDLYCRKKAEVEMYMIALFELLDTYQFQFRNVVICAPDNPVMLQKFSQCSFQTILQDRNFPQQLYEPLLIEKYPEEVAKDNLEDHIGSAPSDVCKHNLLECCEKKTQ